METKRKRIEVLSTYQLVEQVIQKKKEKYETFFKDIIKYGGIVVVAAGNDDKDAKHTVPANSDLVITVGAFQAEDYWTKWDRKKASFSNYGEDVDIWAPGHMIYSAIASDPDDEDKYEYY
eukprot:217320_1